VWNPPYCLNPPSEHQQEEGLIGEDGSGIKDYMHALDTELNGVISRTEFAMFMTVPNPFVNPSPTSPVLRVHIMSAHKL